MKVIRFEILILIILNSTVLLSQSNMVTGTYELSSPYHWMKFTFNDDSTFLFTEFYDVGGRRPALSGKYYLHKDTIKLVFPDSLFQNDIIGEYDRMRNWKLLLDGYKIYHYADSGGNYNKTYPLINIRSLKKSISEDFKMRIIDIDSTRIVNCDTLFFSRFEQNTAPFINDWQFYLPYPDTMKITLYNKEGEIIAEIFNEYLTRGYYSLILSPKYLPNNKYIIEYKTGRDRKLNKFLLVR